MSESLLLEFDPLKDKNVEDVSDLSLFDKKRVEKLNDIEKSKLIDITVFGKSLSEQDSETDGLVWLLSSLSFHSS